LLFAEYNKAKKKIKELTDALVMTEVSVGNSDEEAEEEEEEQE